MPTSPSNKPRVALSMGDPSGIGPEIVLKSLDSPRIKKLADFIVVGDEKILKLTARSLGRRGKIFSGNVRVVDLGNVPAGQFYFGRKMAVYGKAAVEYVRGAYSLIESRIADCIVTAPINKSAIRDAGFKFPGHTEFLADLSGAKKFVMMLSGGGLKVSLVTRHVPISEVSKRLRARDIIDTVAITIESLKSDFNIRRPKVGVCALNPHGGEGGIFGKEEAEKIAPAVRKFKKENVEGPLPADALFYEAYKGRFDCIVCIYHDQGLIPLKMVARDEGVNVTLGLKFIRTSPDHGTAFDIAGSGKADPRSMEAAIKMAVSMALNRRKKC